MVGNAFSDPLFNPKSVLVFVGVFFSSLTLMSSELLIRYQRLTPDVLNEWGIRFVTLAFCQGHEVVISLDRCGRMVSEGLGISGGREIRYIGDVDG